MKAFHNDQAIKDKYLARVVAHINADNLVRGATGKNGKGCAVFCTLDIYDHARYPIELGIPEWLARVEDSLFEKMSIEKSKTWPADFLAAINVGADLEKTKVPFLIMTLETTLQSMAAADFDAKKFPEVTKAIEGSMHAVEQMIHAHKNGLALQAALSAACSAWPADSACSTARSAAADSAARAAESAAYAAACSAWPADSACSTARAAAACSAWSTARSAAYDFFADELLLILKERKS